jgi:hypothetical protein
MDLLSSLLAFKIEFGLAVTAHTNLSGRKLKMSVANFS